MNDIEARRVLGLDDGFTAKDLTAAYRRAAKAAHPDVGGDPADMRRVTDARDLLATVLERRGTTRRTTAAPPPRDDRFEWTRRPDPTDPHATPDDLVDALRRMAEEMDAAGDAFAGFGTSTRRMTTDDFRARPGNGHTRRRTRSATRNAIMDRLLVDVTLSGGHLVITLRPKTDPTAEPLMVRVPRDASAAMLRDLGFDG